MSQSTMSASSNPPAGRTLLVRNARLLVTMDAERREIAARSKWPNSPKHEATRISTTPPTTISMPVVTSGEEGSLAVLP